MINPSEIDLERELDATWLFLAVPAVEMVPKLALPSWVFGLPRLTEFVALNDSNRRSAVPRAVVGTTFEGRNPG